MRRAKLRYKEIRLGQLRAFCECVRHKPFSAAARALGMSQPALWEQVRALERELGASLLSRQGREWKPSDEGTVLLETAGSIVGAMDSLREHFEAKKNALPQTLTIVAPPGVMMEELAGPVVEFSRLHPHIKTILLNYFWTPIPEMVISGEADMAILPLYPQTVVSPLLVTETLCHRLPALALPEGHALASKRRIGFGDIVRYPLILTPRANSPWRAHVDDTFRQAGLLDRMRVLLEVGFTLASRHYVSRGLGIALLPIPKPNLHIPGVHIRLVKDLFRAEEIAILWRRGATPRLHARLFVDYTREWLSRRTLSRKPR